MFENRSSSYDKKKISHLLTIRYEIKKQGTFTKFLLFIILTYYHMLLCEQRVFIDY